MQSKAANLSLRPVDKCGTPILRKISSRKFRTLSILPHAGDAMSVQQSPNNTK